MKKIISVLFVLVLAVSMLCACGSDKFDPVSTDIDFETSNFKHINNGGVTEDETLPYNIDAITGATLTVEGPAVVTSIPLSIREVENLTTGLVRGTYKDSEGTYVYEGVDVYHMIHEMIEGDNGIKLTDTAYKVVFKNANREDISTLTIAEIDAAHEAGRPIILAYGIGSTDEKEITPFVFDGVDANTHSLGYSDKLKNDDGCIKLVYDNKSYGDGSYKTFVNTAYVYVCEETTPGFKHSGSSEESFGASRYTDYILTFRGAGLGHEFDLTVEQLEDLVTYDKDGNVVKGGIGYSDWYSLANNAYWYVNEYEGLQLYELLQYLGMESAEEMGTKAARTTIVSFVASDGVAASEKFSVDTLSYPEAFGFYKKNAQDPGDGTYVPSNADLVKLGYPVLLSYGVNDYPYTISKSDDAYVSGLSNAGGPLRVVFGKTQYAHPNGSNQVQLASEVIVGEDVLYNTHKYTEDADQKALAENKIKVQVTDANGKELLNGYYTIGEIEDVIYGADVTNQNKKSAKVKDSYELGDSSSVFEGVDVEYLFMNVIGLPGMNGKATFTSNEGSTTIDLATLFAEGYNTNLNRDNMIAILAFAKNGTPLVNSSADAGYYGSYELSPYLDSDPKTYTVDNQGGPLMLLVPSSSTTENNGTVLTNVTEINIELIPDSYAHIEAEYAKYQKNIIKFYGPGLEKEKTYTVADLEGMQITAKTSDFSMLNSKGTSSEERFRGIPVYELFKLIGINNNAGDVTITCADGSSQTYSLMTLKKAYANNLSPDKDATAALIAYGKGDVNGDKLVGTPLTDETGGPLMLVVPQESTDSVNKSLCLKNIVSVYVDANEVNTWSHSMSDVFAEFLDYKLTVTIKNNSNEVKKEFTVAELEAMEDIIVRDSYTVLDLGECEGIDIWKLIRKVCNDKVDFSTLVSITAYAEDDYKNDLLANCGLGAFENGIEGSKKIILSYALRGYPLVDTENHEGYTGMAKNSDGPLRVVVEGFQGGSIKHCNKIVVTLSGDDPIVLD